MDVMRTGCSMLGTLEPEAADRNIDAAKSLGDRLIACFGSILIYWYHFSHNKKRIEVETDDDSIAAHFLQILHGEVPSELHIRAMNTSLVLYAEHEFNASTLLAASLRYVVRHVFLHHGRDWRPARPKHGGANERRWKS